MLETLENLPEYHDVVARTLGNVASLIANKQEVEAHTLMKYMIVYAYSSMRMEQSQVSVIDLQKEIDRLELPKINDTLRLTTIMTFYLSSAGFKPVQREKLFGSRFAQVREEL